MTKLKLKIQSGLGEVLTKEELKHVFGGSGSGSGSGSNKPFCSKKKICPGGSIVSCEGYRECGYAMDYMTVIGVYCDNKEYICPEY